MKKILILAGGLMLSQTIWAAGFEKGIMFGGQTSGLVGIGSPYMQGSQALYFNPAGLVSDKEGMDISLNVSPTFPTFKAPIENPSSTDTSKSQTFLPFGLMFGQTVSDKLGWGVGAYVVGGNSAEFDNITLGGHTFDAKTDLSILEIAAGVGYKVMDNLKIGAAYRIDMVSADLDSAVPVGGGNYAQVDYSGLKDTNYLGYKLGAQYKLDDNNKLGLVYRSEMGFKAKGSFTQHVPAAGSAFDKSGDVTVGSVFPEEFNLGYEHDYSDMWRSYAELVWAQYSKVTNLAINQSGSAPAALELQNKDMTVVRLAGQYLGYDWPIRFGFAWTSQVSNADHALATATPPGSEYTLTLGTGHAWGNWRTDAGFEYSWGSGTATGMTAANSVVDYSLHLGGGYTF